MKAKGLLSIFSAVTGFVVLVSFLAYAEPPSQKDGLGIEVTTDKNTYSIGETIEITVKVKNVSASAVKHPPLSGWSPERVDYIPELQLRYFGPGFFRGNPCVWGYAGERVGPRESFADPQTTAPGEEHSVTYKISAISSGSFKIEANFFIPHAWYSKYVVPPGATDSKEIYGTPPQRVEIPGGWTGIIRATKTITIGETVVDEDVQALQLKDASLHADSAHTRHGAMQDIAKHYPYSGRSLLLSGLTDTQVVRSKEDRKVLVKALADLLRRCYASDVLQKLFQISVDINEDIEVRLEALEAYYILTSEYLHREGFVIQPAQDMKNQFTANIAQLKQSTLDKIKKKAEDIEKWSQNNTTIDP